MKRPFAVIGFTVLVTAAISAKLSINTVSAICVSALAVFLLSLCIGVFSRQQNTVIFVSLAVLLVSFSLRISMINFTNALVFEGQKVNVSATVTDLHYSGVTEKIRIKVSDVNGNKGSFYVNVYNGSRSGLEIGDRINADFEFESITEDDESLEYFLAEKCYFTSFKMTNVSLTGESRYYKTVSKVKSFYENVIYSYLPNELGSVAIGMTVGDRTKIDKNLRNSFNYSGTAHLLVVSGLHLTLWVSLITDYLLPLKNKRFLSLGLASVCIFFYLSLTGFSVSVIRAGIMIFVVKLAKCLKKDADSINSLGLALTVLVLANPFSVFSVSLWLSGASTLGLLLFSQRVYNLLRYSKIGRKFTKYRFGKMIAETCAVSVSVSAMTLPVFILNLKMLPVLSFVSNFVMVDSAIVLMVSTMIGVIIHLFGFGAFAKIIFFFTGLVSKFLIFTAEKIGTLRYSTIAVSNRYFRAYLICATVCVCAFLIIRKFRKVKTLSLVIALSLGLMFTVFLSENFELSHPSVDVAMNEKSVTVLLRDGYDSVLSGVEDKNSEYTVGNMLKSHNLKQIGCVFAVEEGNSTPAEIMRVTSIYSASAFAFKGEKINTIPLKYYTENVKSVTLNETVSLTPLSEGTYIVSGQGEDIYISCDKYPQNLFEKTQKYDIIILSADAFTLYGETAKSYLENSSSQIIVLSEGERITIYPDIRRIYYSERH